MSRARLAPPLPLISPRHQKHANPENTRSQNTECAQFLSIATLLFFFFSVPENRPGHGGPKPTADDHVAVRAIACAGDRVLVACAHVRMTGRAHDRACA